MSRRTERREQRAQDFKDQKVKGIKNFDFSQHDPKKSEGGHVSGQEARFVAGRGKQKNAYAALVAQKQAGATFGKRAQSKMDRMGARIEKRAAAKERAQAAQEQPYEAPAQSTNPEDTPATQPQNQQVAMNTGDIDQTTEITNTQEQNIDQDNDQTVTVNGNNNTTISNQDNSIRQYGGDNRSLVINEANTGNQQGSGGGYYNTADKAITMGTLGGFYDVDDSPGAQASFVDQQQTMNRDAQKRYAGQGLATAATYSNYRAGDVDIYGLQSRIDGVPQKYFDMATVQGVRTYGDRDAAPPSGTFEFGAEIKPIESRADEIAEDYKDDIDDM